jgi:hypothetical protein
LQRFLRDQITSSKHGVSQLVVRRDASPLPLPYVIKRFSNYQRSTYTGRMTGGAHFGYMVHKVKEWLGLYFIDLDQRSWFLMTGPFRKLKSHRFHRSSHRVENLK